MLVIGVPSDSVSKDQIRSTVVQVMTSSMAILMTISSTAVMVMMY